MDRFWVGGSGSWSDATNHWASVSGGAPNVANLPTSADNVYFDANSFSGAGQSVIIDVVANCLDMDWTGASNNPALIFASSWNCYGSLTFIPSMTLNAGIRIVSMKSTSLGKTLTIAGKEFFGLTFDGVGGGWTLQDDFEFPYILELTNGNLNTNGKNIDIGLFASSNSNVRTITLGSSIITGGIDFTTSTNLTLNADTSKIISDGTFNGGGKTYYDVEFTGNLVTVTGSNTFHDIKGTAGKTIQITAGTTQTITDMSGDGTPGNLITLESTVSGSTYTISQASGTQELIYYSIKDCTATGGAVFNAYDSVDVSGNTGISFTIDRYWVGGSGNWSDAANHWSYVSGGSPGAYLPAATNNVYFDSNSFSGAGQKVTVDVNTNCLDMDWTGVTNTPSFETNTFYFQQIWGSLILVAGMNLTGAYGGCFYFISNTQNHTVTTAGHTCYVMDFNGNTGDGTGSWQLQDDVSVTTSFILREGSLDTNNKNISCVLFTVTGTDIKALTLGSSIITASGNISINTTNTTITQGTSNLKMTGASTFFNGSAAGSSGGLTYNNLELQGDQITLVGSNTFNDIKSVAGNTIKITAGTTQVIADMSVDGTDGNLITLESTVAGSAFTISKASGILSKYYYSIKDSIATGGAIFDAYSSTDNGGNTGWRFERIYIGDTKILNVYVGDKLVDFTLINKY